ncbi:MAG: M36 family metallopeptidase, partial [Flavobacteriales bacterium]|nr:M36 family metallopeptidase [Flavobacteriales bacterium]
MNTVFMKITATAILAVISLISFAQNNTNSVIQTYLDAQCKDLGLVLEDVSQWTITDDATSKRNGIRHIHIAQTIDGVPLQNGVANITMSAQGEVVQLGNRLVDNIQNRLKSGSKPSITAVRALQLAADAAGMDGSFGNLLLNPDAQHFKYEKGSLAKEEIDIHLAYWLVDENIHLVWVVSLYQNDGAHWWQLFMDAHTGEEVDRIDWVVSCSFPEHASANCAHLHSEPSEYPVATPAPPGGPASYNVFALPLESPNHGNRSMQVGMENPIASPFGWHDTNGNVGEEYTITRGNNVHAYEDESDANNPGFSPNAGGSLVFDYPYNGANNPSTYQSAAITNLFYMNNMMHDIWYNYGFDESSGNFQSNNY